MLNPSSLQPALRPTPRGVTFITNSTVSSRVLARTRTPVPSPVPDTTPRDIASRFGARLRQLRHQHGMSQLTLADTFGIDRTFISDVERGRKAISLRLLEVLALGFKVSLSELMRDL